MKIQATKKYSWVQRLAFQELKSESARKEFEESAEEDARRSMSISIAKFLEPYLPVSEFEDGSGVGTELFVITREQLQIIASIFESIETMCGTYSKINFVQEKWEMVLRILSSDSFEIPEDIKQLHNVHHLELNEDFN